MVKLKIKPRKTKPNKKGHKEQYLEKEATNQRRKERKNYVMWSKAIHDHKK